MKNVIKKVAVKSHKIAVKIRICLPLYPGVKDMRKKSHKITYMLPSELWKAKHIQDAYRDISASFFLLEEVLSGFFVATAPSLLLAALLLWFATLLVFVTRFNFIKSEIVKYKVFF